jgi:alginate O-acetyltransferase complex protein AlgJ
MTRPAYPVELSLVAICALALLAPAADTFLHLDPTPQPLEKRSLAAFPPAPASWSATLAWPPAFDVWLGDHFGMRSTLLAWNAFVKVRALRVAPSPKTQVLIGQDGWLYLAAYGELDYLARRKPFGVRELRSVTATLESQREWLQRHGSRFLVVFAPDKEEIYPEHLPDWAVIPDRPSRLDQLLEALRSSTSVDALDLRPVLREARRREWVYMATDSHWNQRGAHAAYLEIMRRLGATFPGVVPRELNAFSTGHSQVHGDLARMLGVEGAMADDFVWLTPREGFLARRVAVPDYIARLGAGAEVEPVITRRSPAEVERGFFLVDSFGTELQPFLSEHFGRAVFVWSPTAFPAEALEREHPDVVVVELVERRLSSFKPEKPPR